MGIWTNDRSFISTFRPTTARIVLALIAAVSLYSAMGCATVPQDRRARLADPMMSMAEDPLETYSKQKLYTSREGAAGGDGAAAGGGCGCQ